MTKESGKEPNALEHEYVNKYASCLDWRNPHMPIAVTANGGQFVTRASRLPGQFVAPG